MNNLRKFNKYVMTLLPLIIVIFSASACKYEPPRVNAVGLGCEDKYCIWIKGFDFSSNAVVEMRKSDGTGEPIARYENLDRGMNGPDQVLSFRVEQEAAKMALDTNEGVILRVINPESGKFVDTQAVSRKTEK